MSNRRLGICSVVVALVALDITPAAAQYDPFAIAPGPRRVDVSGSGGLLLSSDWSVRRAMASRPSSSPSLGG